MLGNDSTEQQTIIPENFVRVGDLKGKWAPGSKVYHRPSGCRASAIIRNPRELTRAEAEAEGLRLCQNCEYPEKRRST